MYITLCCQCLCFPSIDIVTFSSLQSWISILGLVCFQNLESFRDFGIQGFGAFQKMKQFRVVHFQEHTGDLPGKIRLQAFLMPQDVSPGAGPKRFLTSVDEIEKRTGLDFFTALEDPTEEALEAQVPGDIW